MTSCVIQWSRSVLTDGCGHFLAFTFVEFIVAESQRFFRLMWVGMLWQINDRYEFPLQLDLDRENGKYLSPDADRSVRNLYTLHRFAAKAVSSVCLFLLHLQSDMCWKAVTGTKVNKRSLY
jgi:hypothetical protein